MILGSYRNPPYRTPAPKSRSGPSTSSPAHASPKRKREECASSLPPLQVSNSLVADAPIDAPSPRTTVAERLQGLDISQHKQMAVNDDLPESPRKRSRPTASLGGAQGELLLARPATPEQDSSDPEPKATANALEIEEASDWRARPGSSIFQVPGSNAHPTVLHHASPTPSRRLHSPPPPDPVAQCPASTCGGKSQARDVRAFDNLEDDMDYDQAQFTWQDNEITGQDIDTTTPDDDGLGINGIGFKPTPAVAFARSQKRRQQVNEWKLREAREARQRRIERRRGSFSEAKRTPTVKRTVRFAATS